jgi:hypothetical protein
MFAVVRFWTPHIVLKYIYKMERPKRSVKLTSYSCTAQYRLALHTKRHPKEINRPRSHILPSFPDEYFRSDVIVRSPGTGVSGAHKRSGSIPKIDRHQLAHFSCALKLPVKTTDVRHSTAAPPFRFEIAAAHMRSIRRPFEKSAGDGSADKNPSAS